jgi:hypothetical protein
MSDQATATTTQTPESAQTNEAQETTQQQQAAQPSLSEILQKAAWEGTTPDATQQAQQVPQGAEQGQQQQQAAAQTTKTEEKTPEEEVEYKDPNDWFKEEFKDFGWEDIAKAKEQIAEWRKAKETPVKEELKFENEFSQKAFNYLKEGKLKDLTEHLAQQQKIEALTSGEVTEANAAEIVKMVIKNKYTEFTDADVERKFNKQFGLPKPPVQELAELDEDFAERKAEWQAKVDEIKADLILEAKTFKPELEALKSKLVLPDITPETAQRTGPTQEDLDKAAKFKTEFMASAADSLNKFSGFSMTVKEKDFEIPVSYDLSAEEKKFIEGQIQSFAEQNFNMNEFFYDRWVNEDGTLKTAQMIEDLSRLHFSDKAAQKFASDSAAQRLELYLKEKKNININDASPQGTFTPDNKTQSEKLADYFWNN